MFRFWLFSHFALTSNVSNSSRCFMGSLSCVCKFGFFLVLFNATAVFGLNVVFSVTEQTVY